LRRELLDRFGLTHKIMLPDVGTIIKAIPPSAVSRRLTASSGTKAAHPTARVVTGRRRATLSKIAANGVYWIYLTSKIRRIIPPVPSRLRDREAHIRTSFTSARSSLLSNRPPSKAYILTRLITLIATATLAAAVLFRSPSDFRVGVCMIVSVATITLAVRSLLTGKLLLTLLFLGVLGAFAPFHQPQFSHLVISILDMATMALFAASPIIFGKSAGPSVLKRPTGRL
jgi:hypothetical protein